MLSGGDVELRPLPHASPCRRGKLCGYAMRNNRYGTKATLTPCPPSRAGKGGRWRNTERLRSGHWAPRWATQRGRRSPCDYPHLVVPRDSPTSISHLQPTCPLSAGVGASRDASRPCPPFPRREGRRRVREASAVRSPTEPAARFPSSAHPAARASSRSRGPRTPADRPARSSRC
jgi:hypothetical protein